MTFRLILTSVGGAMSPYTIQRFQDSKRHQIEVVGVDQDPNALGRHFASEFYTVPNGEAPDYVDRIVEIVRKRQIDLILPCSDEEALALSAMTDHINATGAQLALPPPAATAIMSNKLETLRFLESTGIPCPEWRMANSAPELRDAIGDLRSRHANVAVKPIQSRGSRDVYVIERYRTAFNQPIGHRECYLSIDAFNELHLVPSVEAPLLVMEGLMAPSHDTDVLCMNGTVHNIIPRERVNPAGVPFCGGIIRDDPRLISYAHSIASGLNASWLFDIDTMSDANGEQKVIEINCRPSGSLAAATAAGIPVLDDIVSLAKGDCVERSILPESQRVLPYTSMVAIEKEKSAIQLKQPTD